MTELTAAARERWSLWLTCAATFMLIIDITVVNVALPDMQRTLHAQLTDLEWVVDAYSLALGALLLICGSVGDRFGRRKVFLAGMAVFTAGSLWSSLSGSAVTLIVARGIQGSGGAAVFAAGLAIIGNEFRGRELGRALGIWGAAIGAGLAVGPMVGGVLTAAFGWPSIFLVNVPLGIAMIAGGLWRMPESAAEGANGPDWRGFATFGGCLFLLVFGLVEGNRLGWSSGLIIGSLSGAVLLGAAFARLARRPGALFDLDLLRNPGFRAATIAVIGQGVVIASVMLYLVRDLQEVGGSSPLVAGLQILPMTVAAFLAAMAAGRLAASIDPARLLAGALVLLGAGSALMILADPAGSWWLLLPGLVVGGVGWGATNPVAAHASLEAGDAQMTGMISGFNNTARQIGIAAGIGGLGAAFQSRTASVALRHLSSVPARAAARAAKLLATSGVQAATGAAPQHAQLRVLQAGRVSMTSGLHLVELLGAVCAAVVSGCVLFTGRRGRRVGHARDEERDVYPTATQPERAQPGGHRRSAGH